MIYHPNNGGHFGSYRNYFKAGLYRKRYPLANSNTFAFIASYLSNNKIALDIGCGDGRYSVPMSKLVHRINCLDISEEAVTYLRNRIQSERLTNTDVVICDPPVTLYQNFEPKTIDVVTLIFGVLSHVVNDCDRKSLLAEIHSVLSYDGIVVLSVPNKHRRFLKEQREQGSSSIIYNRNFNAITLQMQYKLFDIKEITRELHDSDFSVLTVKSESILPESLVVKHRWIGKLDRILCHIVPRRWAYGLLISARKQS